MSVSAGAYNQTLYDFQLCLDEKNRYLEALEKIFDTAPDNGEDVSYLIAKNVLQPDPAQTRTVYRLGFLSTISKSRSSYPQTLTTPFPDRPVT